MRKSCRCNTYGLASQVLIAKELELNIICEERALGREKSWKKTTTERRDSEVAYERHAE
jgi:hypothetical protein